MFDIRYRMLARIQMSGARLQSVSLMHIPLAARTSLLDVSEQSATVEQAPQLLLRMYRRILTHHRPLDGLGGQSLPVSGLDPSASSGTAHPRE